MSEERMQAGGFTLVRRRGGRRGAGRPAKIPPAPDSAGLEVDAACSVAPADLASLARRIDEAMQELRTSLLWQEISSLVAVGPEAALVGLGIGSFATAPAPRYQMAMALLLRAELQRRAPQRGAASPAAAAAPFDAPAPAHEPVAPSLREVHVAVFDPVFSALERHYLEMQGCEVLAHNDEGRCVARTPTLFFLPHCGRQLYSNLLGANWSAAQLPGIRVLGNSFGAYGEAIPDGKRQQVARWCALARAAPITEEQTCGQPAAGRDADFCNAFNNLSFHTFHAKDLPPDGRPFWTLEPQPADDSLVRRDIVPAAAGSSVGAEQHHERRAEVPPPAT